MAVTVRAPKISVNEPDMRVVGLCVVEGARVTPGEVLCILETTKAALELTAESEGYVKAWYVKAGDIVRVGDPLCNLGAESGPPVNAYPAGSCPAPISSSKDPQLTNAARTLARRHGINVADLPRDRVITEEAIRSLIGAVYVPETEVVEAAGPMVVYGGGTHGLLLVALLRQIDRIELRAIVDDGLPTGSLRWGLRVAGGYDQLAALREEGIRIAANAVPSLPRLRERIEVARRLQEAGIATPPLVHPRAIIDPGALLMPGAQILAGAQVATAAKIGAHAIINTGAIVSETSQCAEFATLAPGAILAGGVSIGPRAIVGMGVLVNAGVRVGSDSRIGNGAIIHEDVPDGTFVPSGSIWPIYKRMCSGAAATPRSDTRLE
jgi:sugar O-acyltransferase (sialic acid O-acetyltransferase NeuD family)